MILIYFIFAGLFGLTCMAILRHYNLSEKNISLLTVIIVIFSMVLAKEYVIPYYRAATYEFFLKRGDPTFDFIASKFPDQFHAYITEVKKSIIKNGNKNNIELLFQINFLDTVFKKAILTANNESIYNYYEEEIQLYNSLYSIDPKLVLFLEFSNKFKKKPSPGLIFSLANNETVGKLLSAKEAVIMSSLKAPQPPLSSEQKNNASKQVKSILANLSKTFGQRLFYDTMNDPESPAINQKMAAFLITSFYEEVLDTGANNAGTIFKYLNHPS